MGHEKEMSQYRYEIKFVLNETAYAAFMSWMFAVTRCRKRFADRTVNSIYFDDIDFTSVKDNLSGLPDRLKTRLRWYQSEVKGVALPLVLEEKIRLGRLGSKNSLKLKIATGDIEKLPLADVMASLRSELPLDHDLSRHHFSPVLNVSYSRQYFEDTIGLRITIDEKIRFRSNFSLARSLETHRYVQYQSRIAELKFDPRLKDTVKDLLRPLNISPVRHSKYMTGMAMFGQVSYL